MKTIFLSSKEKNRIAETYDILDIEIYAPELLPIRIYVKEDILNRSEDFTDVEYILSGWNMPIFTEEEIKLLFPKLIAVFYGAGSVKYFAEPFFKRGIRIYSARYQNAESVAEFVCAQIVLAQKGYFSRVRFAKQRKEYLCNPKRSSERIIGIIGFGAVGHTLVEKLRIMGYDGRVLVYDPYVEKKVIMDTGCRIAVSLDDLFRNSDIISNHLPDIPETRNILNYYLFSVMKNDAVFINTGRGNQVDERGLYKALIEKEGCVALLDILRDESTYKDNALLALENCFVSPHIAGAGYGGTTYRLGRQMLKVYKNYVMGKTNDISEVCEEMLDKMA